VDVAHRVLEVIDIEILGVTTNAGEAADVCNSGNLYEFS
jgi:hypothetical protein